MEKDDHERSSCSDNEISHTDLHSKQVYIFVQAAIDQVMTEQNLPASGAHDDFIDNKVNKMNLGKNTTVAIQVIIDTRWSC